MNIIAWIVLGAIAGYLAGFLAGVLLGKDPIDGALDISSIVTATIGGVIAVVGWNALAGRTRTGRGMV